MKRQEEFSLHQSNFTSDGQHLAVPHVTSGGSRREADKNLSADIREASSGNNTIAISQASISLNTSLTEP